MNRKTPKLSPNLQHIERGTEFLHRQRLPHDIDHADFTIFSTLAGKIFPFWVDVAAFAGCPGRFFFLGPCAHRGQLLSSTVVAASTVAVSAEITGLAAV